MRSTNGPASRQRRKRWLKAAKGFRMRRSKLYRYAKDALDHGRQYAYRDRKNKKRTFRGLWNVRINAACRPEGLRYSQFINGLNKAFIALGLLRPRTTIPNNKVIKKVEWHRKVVVVEVVVLEPHHAVGHAIIEEHAVESQRVIRVGLGDCTATMPQPA